MKILSLVFCLMICSQAFADRIADCYVDCYESIQFYIHDSSDSKYCRVQLDGDVVWDANESQNACVVRETVLLRRDVVGYGDCQSPAAWKRWKSQCSIEFKKWAHGRCLSLVGLVSGKPRCE
jgi:hypothetical protein